MVSRAAVTRALRDDTAHARAVIMPLPSIEDELSPECQNARRVVEQLVEMAELAFARRQFQNSLDSSNQVLRKQRRQGTLIGGKKPETLLDMVESLSVPCLGWEKVMKPSPGRARAWRVDYGSEREITLEDRAAAVALQSIYELSKVDAQYKNDVCFLQELDPFVKYYFYDNDDDEQFCISLGSSSIIATVVGNDKKAFQARKKRESYESDNKLLDRNNKLVNQYWC
jgi:hypothetical protein